MLIAQVPSESVLKLGPTRLALSSVWPGETFDVQGHAVELQDRSDLAVNAQPEGLDETLRYVRARRMEMREQLGMYRSYLDICIESGAIDGVDVAVVAVYTADGREVVTLSQGVRFPEGTLEEARRRGFKTTTAGDIIHEWYPDVPSNAWQGHPSLNMGMLSREEQIREAVMRGLLIVKNR